MKLNRVYFIFIRVLFLLEQTLYNFRSLFFLTLSFFIFSLSLHSTYYRFTLSGFARPLDDKFPYRFPGKTHVSVKNVRVA